MNDDKYQYIISIDLGTTFSGSCYSSIKDRNRIVHVVRWPGQSIDDNFEKTPTVCLYNRQNPLEPMKWGKDALQYVKEHHHDPHVFIVDKFKPKLRPLFDQKNTSTTGHDINITAAIDYLHAIHEYTCSQIIQRIPEAKREQFRYILTVPATWLLKDNATLREIASKAGLVDVDKDSEDRLMIMNEAHAAALFCEREYCNKKDGMGGLIQGQRYLVCDAGGGTVDLATYECISSTDSKNEHCQLALESGDSCGSTILDDHMEAYLRDHIFFGCAEEAVVKNLTYQFTNEIKHFFGGEEPNRNNFKESADIHHLTHITKSISLDATDQNLLDTAIPTTMMDVNEKDYNYNDDYQDYDSNEDQDEEQEKDSDADYEDIDMDDYDDDDDIDMFVNSSDEEENGTTLTAHDFVYFTLPKQGIDPSVLENWGLQGHIVGDKHTKQLRISHQNIAKYVFDPVVERVLTLIRDQIKKSHTKIDTLFLLGGFGQSPYLYKKIHEEFITNTNSIQRLIVPEHGYRASMRGAIHFAIDCIDSLSHGQHLHYNIEQDGVMNHSAYKFLIAIDFNFKDLDARYSIIRTDGPFFKKHEKAEQLNYDVREDFNKDAVYRYFSFDKNVQTGENNSIAGVVYRFVTQLFKHIKNNFESSYPKDLWILKYIRYSITIASTLVAYSLPTLNTNSNTLTINSISEDTDWDPFFDTENNEASTYLENEGKETLRLVSCIRATFKEMGIVKKNDHIHRLFFLDQTKSYLSFQFMFNSNRKSEPQFMRNLGRIGREKNPEIIESFGSLPCLAYEIPARSEILQSLMLKLNRNSICRTRDVFVFDLGQETMSCTVTQYLSSDSINKEDSKVSSFDIASINTHSFSPNWQRMRRNLRLETEYYNLNNEFKMQSATIYTFLKFLAIESNTMTANVRKYIKENVDLTNPLEFHMVSDIFKDPGCDIQLSPLSTVKPSEVFEVFARFSSISLSTHDILLFIIVPWIRFQLTIAILDGCQYYRESHHRATNEPSILIFSVDLLQTKTQGSINYLLDDTIPFQFHQPIGENHFLFSVLHNELKTYFDTSYWKDIKCTIDYDTNPDHTRHMDSIVAGITPQQRKKPTRVCKRHYAIHFVKHITKKYGDFQNISADKEFEEKNRDAIIDLQSDCLLLHPLLNKLDKAYSSRGPYGFKKEYYVQTECHLAAVIYGSEADGDQEYSTVNNSFKKLHRFIIPVKDVSKPIQVSFQFEKHTLLFTMRHDDYEADFDCDDYIFVAKPRMIKAPPIYI